MKRINYLFISLGYITSILSIILIPNSYIYVEIIVITLLFSIGIKKCEKKNNILKLTILNIWIVLFNIIAIILKYTGTIDLYNMNLRLFVQYILPFLITLITPKTNNENLQ